MKTNSRWIWGWMAIVMFLASFTCGCGQGVEEKKPAPGLTAAQRDQIELQKMEAESRRSQEEALRNLQLNYYATHTAPEK